MNFYVRGRLQCVSVAPGCLQVTETMNMRQPTAMLRFCLIQTVLPTGYLFYNGLGWAAAANGKNIDAAWSLIEYLGSKEAQIEQAKLGITMSAYIGTSDAWIESVPAFNLNGHMDMLDAKLIFRPYSRDTTVWEDMLIEKLQDAWAGERPVDEVCKDIANEMNADLAEE